jgi:50S ribosomal protein L16 3-hydroxylase
MLRGMIKFGVGMFGELTKKQFLEEYWQKKPLLIRGAIPELAQQIPMISPSELAGLSCEEDVHSRLVLEQGPERPWQVSEGPFDSKVFENLSTSKSKWSLLVQEVENWVDAVFELKNKFNFIPSWRVDDVMVSYAPDQSSVGAHIDHYDVFLLQGYGQRKWSVGGSALINPEIKADIDLKILSHFEPDNEYILSPGDLLYLPPEFAHHGVAIGECMTYSVGFRSPSKSEILESFMAFHQERLQEEFYTDPDLSLQGNSFEISDLSIERVSQLLKNICDDPQSIRHWFGQLVSSNKKGEMPILPDQKISSFDQLLNLLTDGKSIVKNDQLRFSFCRSDDQTLLFIDGAEFILSDQSSSFVARMCQGESFSREDLESLESKFGVGSLLAKMFSDGYVFVADA